MLHHYTHRDIKTILNTLTNEQIEMLKVETIKNGARITMIHGINIFNALMYKYSTFECCHANNSYDFINVWNNFIVANIENIYKIYSALKSEYNPIENYNRNESSTITTNNHVSTGAELGNSPTITTYKTTQDNDTFYKVDKSENTGKTESDGNGTTTTSSNVSGNIGVTTNQQMIESELKLRIENNLTDIVIDMFYDRELL